MKLTSDIPVLNLTDASPLYRPIGYDTKEVLEYAKAHLFPESENCYIANDDGLCRLAAINKIERNVFGGLPVQAGWCFGAGRSMNGVEWHKTSEAVIACSECVLILGDLKDVQDGVYDTANSVALHLRKGDAVELRPETLHLAPLATEKYFTAAIILPKGTNAPIERGSDEVLRAVNKWMLAHTENAKAIACGAATGVFGDNISTIANESGIK